MNIYAFPLPGDFVIRPETRDEMVDRMAAEALAEVREMANAARRGLGIDDLTLFSEAAAAPTKAGLHPELEAYMWRAYGMQAAQNQLLDVQRAAAMQNAANAYPYNFGGLLNLFTAFPRTV